MTITNKNNPFIFPGRDSTTGKPHMNLVQALINWNETLEASVEYKCKKRGRWRNRENARAKNRGERENARAKNRGKRRTGRRKNARSKNRARRMFWEGLRSSDGGSKEGGEQEGISDRGSGEHES